MHTQSQIAIAQTGSCTAIDVVEAVLEEICTYSKCPAGVVVTQDELGRDRVECSRQLPADCTVIEDGARCSVFSGPCGEALATRAVIVMNDPRSDPRMAPWLERLTAHGIRMMVCVPLFHGDQALGICVLYDHRTRDVDQTSVTVLNHLGNVLASALVARNRAAAVDQELLEHKRFKAALEQAHTERQIAEDAIRASENKYRTLVEASPFCIKLIDSDGRLMTMNRAGLDMLGEQNEEDIVGRHYMQAVCVEDYDRIAPELEKALAGQYTEFEFRAAAGPYFRANLVPILDSAGRVHRLLGVTEDITMRKKDEQARQELEHCLRQSQKMEAIGQLAGGVAHDFNNFLTVILGNSELLLSSLRDCDALGKDGIIGLAQIHAAGTKAAAVTKQLLAFSRKDISNPGIVDVVVVASEMQSLLRRLIGDRYSLELQIVNEPPLVLADRAQLDQVLLNLVNNAADSMPGGGPISVTVSRVTLDQEHAKSTTNLQPGTYVTMRVEDEGHGIAPDEIERIFEPFYTTKPIGKGTGLGLSTVYGTVEQFNGHIEVESTVGQGSSFTVYLPSASTSARGKLGDDNRTPRESRGGQVVLVCEDDELVRVVTCTALRVQGYEVLEASSGAEALDIVDRQGTGIDLLLSDVVMPNMTGPELAEALRKRFPDLRVLFVSGYASELLEVQGLIGSSVGFLQKPFGPQVLLDRVRAVLGCI